MASVITYDISPKHLDFKELMFQLGYNCQIEGTTRRVIYSQNTTLYHANKSVDVARDDSKCADNQLRKTFDKCIVTHWGPQLGCNLWRTI